MSDEALVNEQEKLLHTLGAKLDKLEQETIYQLESEIVALKQALTLIGDIGYDYDGYGTPHDLKKLIDEMVGYARNPQSAVDALLEEQEDA